MNLKVRRFWFKLMKLETGDKLIHLDSNLSGR